MSTLASPLAAVEADALRLPRVRHGFFTRQGGVSQGLYGTLNAGQGSGDIPESVAENRRRIAGALAVEPDSLMTMHQTHSVAVLAVRRPLPVRPKVDALVTVERGVALAVLTADCAPILLCDAGAGVAAAVHAGWRGALGGIVAATVASMEAAGARARDVVAAIGPTIAQVSYEVGAEVADRVAAECGGAAFLRPSGRPGHHLFDLPGYLREALALAGVGTVADVGLDTYGDAARFFSYRRATHRGEGDYGRLLSAIVLEG